MKSILDTTPLVSTMAVHQSFMNYKCYDDKTEILTENGWELFKDLIPNERVATLRNKYLEYVKPTKYYEYQYNGILYGVTSKFLDFQVTPNHNMYVSKRRDSKFKLIPINQIDFNPRIFRHWRFKRDGRWRGREQEFFALPEYHSKYIIPSHFNGQGILPEITRTYYKPRLKIKMDLWLEFLGYYLSEGCVSNDNRGNYRVFISQKKSLNRDKIERCLEKLPWKFFVVEQGFLIANKQLWNYLRQFGHAKDKFISREILELSSRQLKVLFDALMLGDGSGFRVSEHGIDNRGYPKSLSYFTISKTLADEFQELCLKVGMASSLFIKNENRNNNIYRIGINSNSKQGSNVCLGKHQIVQKKYSGKVYCVEVPTHVIYVRRNGKAFWCGNSGV
ncbi:hypothetical protein GW950_02265, partial [Candidatus Wolfebacteria bacterium]|nr:hypothetical protein [Candidatus Wolfebacteria bacterium]